MLVCGPLKGMISTYVFVQSKDTAEYSNEELERSVRAMERNVQALENGNLEADDSEVKIRYDNQRQLNVQLQEQKRWLEHELEQVWGFFGKPS